MKVILAAALMGACLSFFGSSVTGSERILCVERPNFFSECGNDTWLQLVILQSDHSDPSTLELENFVPGATFDTQVFLYTELDARGWSYRVEHDSRVLALVESSVTTRSTRVEAFTRGGGFESTRVHEGGYESVVGLPSTEPEMLPREFDHALVCNASYTLVADPGPDGTKIRFERPHLTGNAARLVVPERVVDGVVRTGKGQPSFRRGDLDADGKVSLTDAVLLLHVLLGGQDRPFDCVAAGDSNADGTVNLTDAVALLNWMFRQGPSPAEPFPTCGTAPVGADCRESSPRCD